MSTAYERAVRLLGELSVAELEQVGARVAALRALTGPASNPPVEAGRAADLSFAPLFYAALAAALEHETGSRQPSYFVFLKTNAGRRFLKAVAAAEAVHLGWFPKSSRVETASLCHVYARAVVPSLQPLNWVRIVSAIEDLPEHISGSFPGYARSGLISMLLHRSTHE